MIYQLYKQRLQERDHLAEKEDQLLKTINMLLPETNKTNLSVELMEEAQKKKRRQQHL